MKMTWLRRPKGPTESEVALQSAQRNLERIQDRASEVKKVTEASRKLLNKNGFAERLEGIMGGQT